MSLQRVQLHDVSASLACLPHQARTCPIEKISTTSPSPKTVVSINLLGKDFTTAGRILGLPHGRLHLLARPAGPRTSNPAGACIISNVDFSFKTSNCAPVYFPALPFSLPLSLCRGFISSPHLLSLGFLSLSSVGDILVTRIRSSGDLTRALLGDRNTNLSR